MHNDHSEESQLYKIRHSLAHVLAQAVMEFRPGTKLGFGPPIDEGFYYDFILPTPITEEDFPEIEKLMRRIIKLNQKFTFEDLPKEEALKRIEEMGEPYKKEYAQELIEKKQLPGLRFYASGKFIDMCEGPHLDNTNKVPPGCFKLKSVAGAYWRGDSRNIMMTRIYAWAFETEEELKSHVRRFEEALARDHKKLGKELDIYHLTDEIGKGLPLWLPNGTVIRDELEKYMKELEFQAGYQRVVTPLLSKPDLFYKTGHLPYYAPHMFPVMEIRTTDEDGENTLKEAYVLKPMNCPHHHMIFSSRPRSYKELPLRLAEYGVCHRYEDSGAVSGLMRVRALCMNDAHIYLSEEQIEDEFVAIVEMHSEVYKRLGITEYSMRLSTWDPEDPKGKDKYIHNPEAWLKTEDMIKKAMVRIGKEYHMGVGDGAFYGPKLDFQLRSVTGREETISTVQIDFGIPERLNLKYVDSQNVEKTPYVLHRAPAGTHERFVAFLIEHYGGAFPTWLAPEQVIIIPVSEKFQDYCQKLEKEFRKDYIRCRVDDSGDSFNKKIRHHVTRKVPNLLIIGENEVLSESVTLRKYGIKEQRTLKASEYKEELLTLIRERVLDATPMQF